MIVYIIVDSSLKTSIRYVFLKLYKYHIIRLIIIMLLVVYFKQFFIFFIFLVIILVNRLFRLFLIILTVAGVGLAIRFETWANQIRL